MNMATQNLDLEEQEQLATLKGWWHDNGNLVLGVIVAMVLAVAAWWGWHRYQRDQALQASALYDALAKGARSGDAKVVRDAGGALTENFSRTLYAAMGALAMARFHSDRGDARSAKAQLQWVIERSNSDDLYDIARLRLAALLLDEKAYDEALKLLEAKHADPYAAQYAAARGDLLQAKGQSAEAKSAYRQALDKAEAKNEAFRASVQLRLDALGG
jgi:predicted negative regulator of RcsB-dependent stress response